MAQKVTTQLVDDLSGDVIEPGRGRSIQFAFDGSNYEIDLTDHNADSFRAALSDYIAAARRVTQRTSAGSASKHRTNSDELARIRQWAAANGYDVAARGRISQSVRDAYTAAN